MLIVGLWIFTGVMTAATIGIQIWTGILHRRFMRLCEEGRRHRAIMDAELERQVALAMSPRDNKPGASA